MELSGEAFAFALLVVFAGAAIRGFTGFGASLIWVSGLTLLVDPDEAVPIIFCLEVVASLHLIRSCRDEVMWKPVRRLVGGALIGMPIGVAALLAIDPEPMKLVVSVVVLVAALVLAAGWRSERELDLVGTGAVGVGSGVLNGLTSAGGPPVIVFFLGSPAGMAAGRASLIAYFLFLDALGIVVVAVAGLLDTTALIRFAAFTPAMLVGAAIGARWFGRADPERARFIGIAVLVALAVVGIVGQL
ncbi:MAG: sulfite exporter TauE/SafE family protein [Actinomycetota bacterium]